MFEVNQGIIQVSYIIATILFILALGGLSNQETAKVLDINESTASNRFVRALKKLKAGVDGEALL